MVGPSRIIIDVDDRLARDILGNKIRKFRKLTNTTGYKIARAYAAGIRDRTAIFTYPRGYTKKTIRAVRVKDGVSAVKMPGWAWAVEFGRPLGKGIPYGIPKVEAWERAMGYNKGYLSWSSKKRGIAPRPFISKGIAAAEPRVKEILREMAVEFVRR